MSCADELTRELARDAAVLRSFDSIAPSSPEARFFRTIEYMETSTFVPAVLWLFTSEGVEVEDRRKCLTEIESFLVRRALMSFTNKRYNRIAIGLLGKVGRGAGPINERIGSFLARSTDTSATWPTNEDLQVRIAERPMYGWVSRLRITGILTEVEPLYRGGAKSEDVALLDLSLSIEHLMPQSWEEHWPLVDPTPDQIDSRNTLVDVLGNLTLVTGSLNSSLSNQPWPDKRRRFREHSPLLLNSKVAQLETWDEETIQIRGTELTQRIFELWPGPERFDAEGPSERWQPELEPEKAKMADEEIAHAFEGGSQPFQALLLELADHVDETRTISEVEAALAWSTGKLASVLGGYATRSSAFGGRRPYHLIEDQDGMLSIWMDRSQGSAVGKSTSV